MKQQSMVNLKGQNVEENYNWNAMGIGRLAVSITILWTLFFFELEPVLGHQSLVQSLC
jgi:hypothetical protein